MTDVGWFWVGFLGGAAFMLVAILFLLSGDGFDG